jgi:hypothetical protein
MERDFQKAYRDRGECERTCGDGQLHWSRPISTSPGICLTVNLTIALLSGLVLLRSLNPNVFEICLHLTRGSSGVAGADE